MRSTRDQPARRARRAGTADGTIVAALRRALDREADAETRRWLLMMIAGEEIALAQREDAADVAAPPTD